MFLRIFDGWFFWFNLSGLMAPIPVAICKYFLHDRDVQYAPWIFKNFLDIRAITLFTQFWLKPFVQSDRITKIFEDTLTGETIPTPPSYIWISYQTILIALFVLQVVVDWQVNDIRGSETNICVILRNMFNNCGRCNRRDSQ